MAHVAGYAIVNDVSARDLIARTDYPMLVLDWLRAKSQPGFCPFGPVLVPAEFVSDPYDLRLLLTLNGQTMQDESTADMLFDIARQIEYVSTYAELWPGDLISTGPPPATAPTTAASFARRRHRGLDHRAGHAAQPLRRHDRRRMMRLVQKVFLANAPTVAAHAIGAFAANESSWSRRSLARRLSSEQPSSPVMPTWR